MRDDTGISADRSRDLLADLARAEYALRDGPLYRCNLSGPGRSVRYVKAPEVLLLPQSAPLGPPADIYQRFYRPLSVPILPIPATIPVPSIPLVPELNVMSEKPPANQVGLTDAQIATGFDVDHNLLRVGQDIIERQKAEGFWAGWRNNYKACCWSLLISTALWMEGYDASVVRLFSFLHNGENVRLISGQLVLRFTPIRQ